MSVVGHAHQALVFDRRVRVLSRAVAAELPRGAHVLDVGCGDGLVAKRIMELRPDVTIEGIDVLVREGTHIPVRAFDGAHLPFADASVDAVIIVDVLHHTSDPTVLLREARRVARHAVVIKDHLADRPFARPTLRVMDWVGNAHHGVALPYNYLARAEWQAAFAEAGLVVERWDDRIPLYPAPLSWLFGGSLHVITRLSPMPRASTR